MADRKSASTPFVRQCFVTAAVCSNVVGFGCAIGFAGVLFPQLFQVESAIPLTPEQASWLVTVGSIPMVFGNFMIPAVMSRAGRKVAHFAVILVMLLHWFTVILATSYEVLLLGRILQGLAFGFFMPLRSILIGEYTSPQYRGGFLATISLAQTFGVLFVHFIGSYISYQMTALVSTAFAFISLFLTIFSPESASWLATRYQYDTCRNNFLWLRREEEIPELNKMIQTIQHLDGQQRNKQNKLKEMILVAKKKEFYKPIFLMFALFIMQSCSGGLLMGPYLVHILNVIMGPAVDAHFWIAILNFARLLFSGVAVYVIHTVKRRTMMFTIGAACIGSQMTMAAYIFAKTKDILPYDALWIQVVLISLEILTVSMGMQPLPIVIAGEVFPLKHRGLAGSIGLVASGGSVFLLSKTFPSLIYSVNLHGTYVLYSGIIAMCLVAAWFLLPETSGRTLQQIEKHFRGQSLDLGVDVQDTELNTFNENISVCNPGDKLNN